MDTGIFRLMKHLLLTIAFLLLCVFITCASAEENNLFPIRENGIWGYINQHGKTVIEPHWDNVTNFVYDYALVTKDEDVYVICEDGDIVFGPYHLDDNNTINDISINPRSFSIGDVIFDCITGKALNFISNVGGMLDDEFADTSTNLLLWLDNDYFGYIDRTTGEWAIPPAFNQMSQDWIYGSLFLDLSDETSRAQFQNGYAVVGIDDDLFLINEQNERVVLPPGYEPCSSVIDGYFQVILWEGDCVKGRGVADISGNILFVTDKDKYVTMRLQSGGILVAFPTYDEVTFLDIHGNELMEPISFFSYERNIPQLIDGFFTMAEDTMLGTSLCSLSDGELWYDGNSRIVWFDPDMDRVVAYYNPNARSEWLDLGNTLFDMDHKRIGDYCELYPFWAPRDIDYKPNELCWNPSWKISDSVVSMYQMENGEIVRGQYFSEGLQAAAIKTDDSILYGYIDATGQFVIQPQFCTAGNFLNGLALVSTSNGLQYIDHDGNIVWSE